MFEKEAEDKAFEKYPLSDRCDRIDLERNLKYEEGFEDGAEFGYNKAKEDADKMKSQFLELCNLKDMRIDELEKANEWHYVSEKGTPKKEGHYLVCLCNKDKDIFDCWIYYDKDVGWYSMKVRMRDIYAWKEIVLPKESE